MPSNSASSSNSHVKLRLSGVVAILVAAAIVVVGITTRASNQEKLKYWTNEQAIPSVSVIVPDGQGSGGVLALPGRFEAYVRAPIYARVSGYLKSWKVDIGGKVKAGQLLGEIETPDIDQQLLQAKADLSSAQANLELAATTANRWQAMLSSDAVSRQEVDDRTGDLAAKKAMVKAAQANVDRLLATKNFARVVAPFDGTVTARETDTGALINAGGGTGPALFEVSDTRKLRLYVNVPQSYAANIKPGTQADLTVPEYPSKTYTAKVESSSKAIDVASGTTLVQLLVDNPEGELLPGGYANVSFHQTGKADTLSIPASSLIFDQAGVRVAVIGADGKVQLKTVTIERDLGKVLELGSGVNANDRIIESPPDGISDGDMVHVVEASQKPAEAPVATKKAL